MKFSGKVWSDHGTTWFNLGSILRNRAMTRCATRGRGLFCFSTTACCVSICQFIQRLTCNVPYTIGPELQRHTGCLVIIAFLISSKKHSIGRVFPRRVDDMAMLFIKRKPSAVDGTAWNGPRKERFPDATTVVVNVNLVAVWCYLTRLLVCAVIKKHHVRELNMHWR